MTPILKDTEKNLPDASHHKAGHKTGHKTGHKSDFQINAIQNLKDLLQYFPKDKVKPPDNAGANNANSNRR